MRKCEIEHSHLMSNLGDPKKFLRYQIDESHYGDFCHKSNIYSGEIYVSCDAHSHYKRFLLELLSP